ncbi:MAG: YceI family protein [Planctomycetota bacterium]
MTSTRRTRFASLRIPALASALALAGAAGVATLTVPADPAAAQRSAVLSADDYTVDTSHSSIVFRIKHAGVAYQYGRFNGVTGSFKVNPDTGHLVAASISVPSTNIDTANEQRDGHLRSGDFFDVRRHREITFELVDGANTSSGKGSATGDLTLMGQSKEVEFDYEFTGAGDALGTAKSGFHGTFTIKRSDFGMTYGIDNGALGDEVTLMVSIEGDKAE